MALLPICNEFLPYKAAVWAILTHRTLTRSNQRLEKKAKRNLTVLLDEDEEEEEVTPKKKAKKRKKKKKQRKE